MAEYTFSGQLLVRGGRQITTTGVQFLLLGKGTEQCCPEGGVQTTSTGIQFLFLGKGRDKTEYQHHNL